MYYEIGRRQIEHETGETGGLTEVLKETGKEKSGNAHGAAKKRGATGAANKKGRQDKLDAEATAAQKPDQSYELELRTLGIQQKKWGSAKAKPGESVKKIYLTKNRKPTEANPCGGHSRPCTNNTHHRVSVILRKSG
ncbi:DUF5384 family protein, partial [Escherichia coli]|nr:DUF5384 family protein [Escherichia coli]